MCLGADARAANKAAMQNYEHKLKVRERKWMNTLALTKTEHVQHSQTLDAAHVGLGNAYAEIQEKYRDLIGSALQEDETKFKQYLQESQGEQLTASGRTGKSVERVATVDFADYLRQGSRKAYELTQARRKLTKEGAKAASVARQAQMESFAKVNIIKSPDITPPPPVMRNVGLAMFTDALKIGSSLGGIATGLGPTGVGLWTT